MLSKIKSKKGASITYALLLFLICAVVGAVVLAAGTAAAGRFKDLVKSDRRYYSVHSAAELIGSQFAGRTVTVERSETVTKNTTTDYTVTYVNDIPSVTEGTPSISTDTVYSVKIDGAAYTAAALNDFLVERTVYLLLGDLDPGDPGNGRAVFESSASTEKTAVSGSGWKLRHDDKTGLDCFVSWKTEPDGSIVFTVSDNESGDRLSVELILRAKINETAVTHTDARVNMPEVTETTTAYRKQEIKTTETVKTLTVEWVSGGIRKEASSSREVSP